MAAMSRHYQDCTAEPVLNVFRFNEVEHPGSMTKDIWRRSTKFWSGMDVAVAHGKTGVELFPC